VGSARSGGAKVIDGIGSGGAKVIGGIGSGGAKVIGGLGSIKDKLKIGPALKTSRSSDEEEMKEGGETNRSDPAGKMDF